MAMSNSSTAQVLPFEAEMPPEGAAQSPRGREISRREQIWQYVEDSTIIGGFIFLVIVFSTVCFVLETEPALKGPELQGMWFGYASMISRRRQHRIHLLLVELALGRARARARLCECALLLRLTHRRRRHLCGRRHQHRCADRGGAPGAGCPPLRWRSTGKMDEPDRLKTRIHTREGGW